MLRNLLKKLGLFILFFIVTKYDFSQTTKFKKQKESNGFILEGGIRRIVGCGIIFYAYAYKFTLQNNQDSSIIGILRCPDGYKDGFLEKGKIYDLQVSRNNILDSLKSYVISNPYENSKLPVYLISAIAIKIK